jgi:hypothetical protein
MASPKEVIANFRTQREAAGLPPLSDLNRKPPLSLVINPEYTAKLSTEAQEYARPNMECWKCDTQVNLEQRPYTWTIGQVNYEFKEVPTYRCEPCNINYFPEPVRLGMVKKIDQLEPVWQPKVIPKRSPVAQAYYDKYGPPKGPTPIA